MLNFLLLENSNVPKYNKKTETLVCWNFINECVTGDKRRVFNDSIYDTWCLLQCSPSVRMYFLSIFIVQLMPFKTGSACDAHSEYCNNVLQVFLLLFQQLFINEICWHFMHNFITTYTSCMKAIYWVISI